jgi:hypothetical protein
MCHSGIHQVAYLNSVVIYRSSKLVLSALKSDSKLLCVVFVASSQLVYTTLGYNSMFKAQHLTIYSEQDELCASSIRDVTLAPDLDLMIKVTIICRYNFL